MLSSKTALRYATRYEGTSDENRRIGTGVSLAAFYDPLGLAEEVALLDVLSGGSVNWGAGSGFDPAEFRAFGIDRENRYP